MKIKYILIVITGLFIQKAVAQSKSKSSSVKSQNSFQAAGIWRGVFNLKPGVEVPFNFEIANKKGEQPFLSFLNADERFDGGFVKRKGDSVLINLDQFDNVLAFKIQKDSLVGVLKRQDGSGKPLPVYASKAKQYRFKVTGQAPDTDFSGKYDIVFQSQDGKNENAVGVFKQTGNKLTGTFLRITGDSRYLEGIVDGNHFYLSGFIGSNPAYYKGTFSKDGKIIGEVVGARGNTPFTGNQNQNAALPDATKLTFLKEGYKTIDFSFPDIRGKKISLSDDKFKNKVVILTITGTWCPNCVDEAAFIAPWYKENRNRGVEVIGIHYERQLDSTYVKKALGRFRDKFGIQYDQVIAGKPDKKQVAESLPGLSNFLSFPTMIIIDKNGDVAQIHTGYSGPATGKYYTDFVKKFNEEIDLLLSKKPL